MIPDDRWYNSRWFVALTLTTLGGIMVFLVMYNARMESRAKQPIGANSEILTSIDSVSVTLRWDANIEPDIFNYDLSYGTSSGVYTATIPTTSTTISVTLSNGVTYFIAVRARNNQGVTGLYSTELVYTTQASTPTPSPAATATATIPPASPTATATAAATATVTPTATATATATPVSTPTPSPNFTITINPQTLTTTGGYLVYSIDIVKSGGFSSAVILSANGLPDGVALRFNPDPTPLYGANLVMFCGFVPTGSYPFTVVGQSFSSPPITRTANGTLIKQ